MKADEYRRLGAADAVVRIARARFWPHVRIEQIAEAAGISFTELRDAVERAIHPAKGKARPSPTVTAVPEPEPKPRPRSTSRPEAPPGTKYCTKCQNFVALNDFGVNRSRRDGYSDFCSSCWRVYWRERRAGTG